MKASAIACRQCGVCCRINVNAFVTEEDLNRWKKEGRGDILHILENEHAVWAGDRLVSAEDGRAFYSCPFLQPRGRRFLCSIYGTRPRTCRNFLPGSSPLCSQFKSA